MNQLTPTTSSYAQPQSSQPIVPEDKGAGGKWKSQRTTQRFSPLEAKSSPISSSSVTTRQIQRVNNETFVDLERFLQSNDTPDFWSKLENDNNELFQKTMQLVSTSSSRKGTDSINIRKRLDNLFQNRQIKWQNCPHKHKGSQTNKGSHTNKESQTNQASSSQADNVLFPVANSCQEIEKLTKQLLGQEAVSDLIGLAMPEPGWTNKYYWGNLSDFKKLLNDSPLDNPKRIDTVLSWLKAMKRSCAINLKVDRADKELVFNWLCIQYCSIRLADKNILSQPNDISVAEFGPLIQLQHAIANNPGITLSDFTGKYPDLYRQVSGLISDTESADDFNKTYLATELDKATKGKAWSWRDFVVDESYEPDADGTSKQSVYMSV
ncbi:hypothetical protein [Endozoicomonas numazuensis]|uniref:Uncharacterized protein n=1 Tax=Endozoicomonas numazuensis TaxID=1137799 RepID=A0A081NEZ7_9GAMM|nr:hypothetical protein [Endozoicomonas numazuensis]KEQ17020.1 hypothetical protein GZ78_20620 [Endozoicomonas numazuensis]